MKYKNWCITLEKYKEDLDNRQAQWTVCPFCQSEGILFVPWEQDGSGVKTVWAKQPKLRLLQMVFRYIFPWRVKRGKICSIRDRG